MELKNKQRLALSVFFFLSGICFSSWTSRIPTIQSAFNLSDAELGTILLTMPIASLIGLPISGWLVSRFDSRHPLLVAFILNAVGIAGIGFAANVFMLVASMGLLSFSFRILNISANTQAITLQKQYDKKINGSFHGLWSTGGIVGVLFSTLMVWMQVAIQIHLLIVGILTIVVTFIAYRFLLRNDRSTSGNKVSLGKPDPYIVYLGLMVFFAAICEGGMFDWSGVYFKNVIGVEIFTLGYLSFMICMALSRFASDVMMVKIGIPRMYILSSCLIMCGIATVTIFPSFYIALIGFCLVGLGTASIIPMTYLLAGGSRKYSAGTAISLIATYSIVGMFIGPPMIGYISQAFNLRVSFIAFALAGLMIIPISRLFFRHQRSIG